MRRVRSPFLRPSFTQRPTMSSSRLSVNVAPAPPASSSTLSYLPKSTLQPPYGPSSITCTGISATSSFFSPSAPAMRLCSSLAYRFSARVQSPLTRAPRAIVRVGVQDVAAGAFMIVRGCDSKTRPPKKTRRRTCCPAFHPPSQSRTWIYRRRVSVR